ncbi:MAG: chemotaxis protein CheW [Oligoflexales bacterium]
MLQNALKIKLKKVDGISKSKGDPYLIFDLNKKIYAVPLNTVHRFEEMKNIHKVPSSFNFFQGVVGYLDDFVGVLNLKKALKIEGNKDIGDILILFKNGHTFLAAAVDDIRDIVSIPKDSIKQEVPLETENNEIFIGFSKMGSEIVTHLNIKSWIGRPDISELTSMIAKHIKENKKEYEKRA